MADAKFAPSGFKYPERIYGHKFQYQPPAKPALLCQFRESFTKMSSAYGQGQTATRSMGERKNSMK